jgi:adenine-specific DNA-methyltransferase
MSANEERISNQSLDLGEFNKDRLLEMFPIFRTEGGGVDFDRLKLALGESVEVGKEVFGMRWPGKADSIRLANSPSLGTLSPDEKESVNFHSTQNLIIEGDNLETLKLLQKSYQGKVKMIYIDPPYNTGNDFVYEDDFTDGIKNYLQQTGQINDEGNRLSTNSETDGRFHSNWMNMMYPRLMLANNLLVDDGIVFVSIDDNEIGNLLSLMDETFGRNNQLAVLIWNKQHSQQQGIFKRYHEYVVVYTKNADLQKNIRGGEGFIDAGALKKVSRANPESEFTFPIGVRFEAPHGTRFSGTFGDSEKVTVVSGVFECKNGKTSHEVTLSAGWTQKNQMKDFFEGKEVIDSKGQRVLEFYFNSAGKLKCRKQRSTITPASVLPLYGMVSESTAYLADLMGGVVFDNPKPVTMLSDFISWFSMDDEIVLDFFAGSGTTAHAVMAQNAKDGGNRKFILVQLPEQVDPESEAAKAGFDNIADITKERVRRAGKKIIEESDGKLKLKGEEALDFGFRVLKLNESNIEDWNSEEASKSPKDLLDALKTTRLKSGRSEQDVVFEVLVKYGIELTSSVEEQKVGKGSVWKISGGELIVVVAPGLANDDLNAIVKMSPKVVVMLDEAFVPEALKTNARATFKDAKIELKTF